MLVPHHSQQQNKLLKKLKKNRKEKINWFSPRWRKLSKKTLYKVKTTPQMETFSKKKKKTDQIIWENVQNEIMLS